MVNERLASVCWRRLASAALNRKIEAAHWVGQGCGPSDSISFDGSNKFSDRHLQIALRNPPFDPKHTNTCSTMDWNVSSIDLHSLNFARNCTLSGIWMNTWSLSGEPGRYDPNDYVLELFKEALPPDLQNATYYQVHQLIQYYYNTTSDVERGEDMFGSIYYACRPAVCKFSGIEGNPDIAGIGVRFPTKIVSQSC